jgi:hypothetical protein
LRAHAAESAVGGHLALIALEGLVVNAFLESEFRRPLAALALLPLIVSEALEARSNKPCCH